MFTDTIFALATAPATPSDPAPRAILRLSGEHAHTLANALCTHPHTTRGMHKITLKNLPISATLMLFQAPRSFTGEHIAELHIPNSPALIRLLSHNLLNCARQKNLPLRQANPGEFSARAFFNGKMDLTEAEGIAATIAARSADQLRAAASLRQGDMHRWTEALAERVTALLASVEAGIDFTEEEDVRFIDGDTLAASLQSILADLSFVLSTAVRFDRLGMPPTVVLVGQPNVGKSSVLNALCESPRSIISPIAGTTRDMLQAIMKTSLGDVRILDVPGEEPASDELREKMMDARDTALLEADLLLEIVSAEATDTPEVRFKIDHIRIFNKADKVPNARPRGIHDAQWLSAMSGLHIPALRKMIAECVYGSGTIAPELPAVNQRQCAILYDVRQVLQDAIGQSLQLQKSPELVAAELRRALDLLGQITGTISPDEVLGRIFATFCIGK